MTEPTDAELEALAVEHEAFGFGLADKQGLSTHGFDPDGLRSFARAVLAEWGTPPAVAGEPVAFLVCTEEGDPDMVFLNRHEAQQYLEDHEQPIPLYTTPQPTQAKAGAVPLTDEQIGSLACVEGLTNIEVPAIQWLVREVEYLHRIKGGQHGAE